MYLNCSRGCCICESCCAIVVLTFKTLIETGRDNDKEMICLVCTLLLISLSGTEKHREDELKNENEIR